MKIIRIDNHAREYVDDILVQSNVTEEQGLEIVNDLNTRHDRPHDGCYILIDDSYQRNIWEP